MTDTDDFDFDNWEEASPNRTLTPRRLRAGWLQTALERLSLHHEMAQSVALFEPTPADFRRRFADLCYASFADPVLLLGGAGVGKTYLVQTLAALADVPFRRLEGGVLTASFELGGTEFNWSSGTPGVAVRVIAETGVANPLILIDEADKFVVGKGTGGDPRAALLPFLQRSTAANFICPYLQASINLSNVSWLLCANSLDGLSHPFLDRLTVFKVAAPKGGDLESLVRAVFDGLDLSPDQMRRLRVEVADGRLSLRGLTRLADSLRRFDTRPLLS